MAKILTTLTGEEIKGGPVPDKVTVYDEDNVAWSMNPIDAREAVATGRYSYEALEQAETEEATEEADSETKPKTKRRRK